MDFNKMAERLGLEVDEFMELAELFIETASSELDRLRSAIDRENLQEVIESSHSIKGSSGNMGFMEIFEVAKGIEFNARDNSLEGAETACNSIKDRIEILISDIEALK